MMFRNGCFALVFSAVTILAPITAWAEDARLQKSRTIAEAFQTLLGRELQEAMAEGGASAAIGICRDEAPRIADLLSAETGTLVSRTALRVRNPGNAPDQAARRVLEEFPETQTADRAAQEHFVRRGDGSARYLRAIYTRPLCATCHGVDLDPELRATLDELYPEDRARGFRVGDLRGAFRVDWPAP